MQNFFSFFGRLVSDVEISEVKGGKSVGTLRIAVRREFKNLNGDYDTDFLKIQLWNGLAQNCASYIKKGDQVLISGRIQSGKYDLGDGKTLNTIELVGEKVTFIGSVPKE